MPGTPGERLSQVWELTREAWALFRPGEAEQRLQRHVVLLTKETEFGGNAKNS
jgi:hypothetical protein